MLYVTCQPRFSFIDIFIFFFILSVYCLRAYNCYGVEQTKEPRFSKCSPTDVCPLTATCVGPAERRMHCERYICTAEFYRFNKYTAVKTRGTVKGGTIGWHLIIDSVIVKSNPYIMTIKLRSLR